MLLASFSTGSATHLITLAVITGLIVVLVVVTHPSTSDSRRAIVGNLVGWGSLAAGILNTAYWMSPPRFDPSQSLPLHFCNLANFIGALAVLKGHRLFQGVLYFWSGLCLWAFLTPTVRTGPDQPDFWIFWLYHGFIALTLVYVLRVARFKPSFRDLMRSTRFTLILVACLFTINAVTGWNYGFLGNDIPGAPTPVDLLGRYPLRVLWMILIGAAVFALLWLPHWNSSTTRTRK